MVIGSIYWAVLHVASNIVLFMLFMMIFLRLLSLIPVKPKRWRSWRVKQAMHRANLPVGFIKLLGVSQRLVEEKQQLLNGCGMRINAALYEGWRRLLMLGTAGVMIGGYFAYRHPLLPWHIHPVYVMTISGCMFILLASDKKLLSQLKTQRAHRIVKEIYVISHHLLYYNDSRLNLHAKLVLCMPQTSSVKPVFQTMLNEWYQDAETAIQHFKLRLGTEEAFSFGETLNALRMNEHGSYYDLLKQRIQDYKEKLELVRDSRKEAVSYVLFVMAGLPIMNTFRVFMYPWIVEGQQLFNSIN
ncbi:hypothetical protein [Paenibacillus aestuarii]|uniref:Type II secretion system protein GspF domain-containing protein n=1 Tax=Paenibacillus aestuarii TaxID=516965 RepID=A0ABW0K0F6_9BACL|nr:hypothetical protein [Paenibacillus aestuarii]